MAYVDKDGLILIDEVEVAEDIKRLHNVLDIVDSVLEEINYVENINSAFDGDTALAISQSIDLLKSKLLTQKDKMENEISYINAVVTNYQTIDSNMKDLINSSLNEVSE